MLLNREVDMLWSKKERQRAKEGKEWRFQATAGSRTEGQTDRRTNGQKDNRIERQPDRRTNGQKDSVANCMGQLSKLFLYARTNN